MHAPRTPCGGGEKKDAGDFLDSQERKGLFLRFSELDQSPA